MSCLYWCGIPSWNHIQWRDPFPPRCNPRAIVKKHLHSKRVTIWCDFWHGGVIAPYFFENEAGATRQLCTRRCYVPQKQRSYSSVQGKVCRTVLLFGGVISLPLRPLEGQNLRQQLSVVSTLLNYSSEGHWWKQIGPQKWQLFLEGQDHRILFLIWGIGELKIRVLFTAQGKILVLTNNY